MWKEIKAFLASKKALMFILSGVAWVVAKLGWGSVPVDELGLLLGGFWAYILGQGMADIGKEAKKLELSAADTTKKKK